MTTPRRARRVISSPFRVTVMPTTRSSRPEPSVTSPVMGVSSQTGTPASSSPLRMAAMSARPMPTEFCLRALARNMRAATRIDLRTPLVCGRWRRLSQR